MKRIGLVCVILATLSAMFFAFSETAAAPARHLSVHTDPLLATTEPGGQATRAIYIPPVMKEYPTRVPTPTPTITPTPVPSLKSRVSQVTLALPHALEGSGNWCTWGWCTLSPRLYHEPLDDGRTMVGWTDTSGNGHVGIIGQDGEFDDMHDFSARSVRGLVAHSDGTFAVLLWNPTSKVMSLSKRQPDGSEMWAANVDGDLTSFDPAVGDSRLTHGPRSYAAYFAVHGDTGWPQGNWGDQLSYVSRDGLVQSGGWEWGCSHSLGALISYHPSLDAFAPICASDCYSNKGILLDVEHVVYAADGDCAGLVSAQLGQIAETDDGWKLVFNALTRPGHEGRGIGLATINSSFHSSYVWLTNTNGEYERDPALARLGTSLGSDRYLVGWVTTNDQIYRLGVIDGHGSFLAGPEPVSSAGIAWGNRDDSFRTRPDGSVSWVWIEPGTSTLHLFHFGGSIYIP